MDKAYKVLARQQNISNREAKNLIDGGLVYVENQKVKIARGDVAEDTDFRILEIDNLDIIFENNEVIAVNKPAMLDSYQVQDILKAKLIHRLDKDTSGVLLLTKSDDFMEKCIKAFKNRNVTKQYIAWVDGIFYEDIIIDTPITTHKQGGKAFSKIDMRNGKPAVTIVKPLEVIGKKSKVEIEIKTGKTHQIRVHLASINYPIVGDEKYGSSTKSIRVLLHAKSIEIFEYKFSAPEPKYILKYK